jgi:hypothetical protein
MQTLLLEDQRLSFSLSARGLRNLPLSNHGADFAFVVGSTRYRCPSFIADFLSPTLARMHISDPTIQEFAITSPDRHGSFADFIRLAHGDAVDIPDEAHEFVLSVCAELGNDEIARAVLDWFDARLTVKNVLPRIDRLIRENADYRTEIGFIASHLYEFIDAAVDLPAAIADCVLSHEGLKIRNEDSLYHFIARSAQVDTHFFPLFEHLQFAYLSTETLAEFINLMKHFFEYFSLPIWEAVCRRLCLARPASPPPLTRVSLGAHLFPLRDNEPFQGIIAFLTREGHENVHLSGRVKVTSSSVYLTYSPWHAANLGEASYFCSGNGPNQWLCYDFCERRVLVTDYALQSQLDSVQSHINLKNWVLEGSIDSSSWIELDRREGEQRLDRGGGIATFKVAKEEIVQMVRIRQIGKNHAGTDFLDIGSFEIFGTLVTVL